MGSARAANSVCSPPQPNPGLPGFGHFEICRKRASPQPAGEGVGVGVPRNSSPASEPISARSGRTLGNSSFSLATTPTPNPSPQGGGEHTESAALLSTQITGTRFSMFTRYCTGLVVVLGIACCSGTARDAAAQPVESFYKGRTVT